ncbi:hypothetical protein GYH30_043034 [Glycine max]|nr:hypothetical protein GYH30_043034 [Glycine max]
MRVTAHHPPQARKRSNARPPFTFVPARAAVLAPSSTTHDLHLRRSLLSSVSCIGSFLCNLCLGLPLLLWVWLQPSHV